MSNSTQNTQSTSAKGWRSYSLRSDLYYGRRKVTVNSDKTYYAIEINGKIISPLFEKLTLMPSFNHCVNDGLHFLTSPDGNEIISENYKKIGNFYAIQSLGKYYAKAESLDGKLGTISSNGNVCIKFENDVLERFGSAYAICGKMVDGEMRYGIFALNGEKVVDYNFVEYEITQEKAVMIKEDGEKWFYSKLGTRIRV